MIMMNKNDNNNYEDDYFNDQDTSSYNYNSFNNGNGFNLKKYVLLTVILVGIIFSLVVVYNVMKTQESNDTKIFTETKNDPITIDSSSITINVEESYYLDPKSNDSKFNYGSMDSSICSVSEEGELVGVKEGTTTITITNSTSSLFVTVKVLKSNKITELLFDDNIEIDTKYSSSIFPNNISSEYIGKVHYTSSDTSIVKIEGDSLYGLKNGTCNIAAKLFYEGEYIYGNVTVNVVEEIVNPESISTSQDTYSIVIGNSQNFGAKLLPEGSSGELIYLNYNTNIISVDNNGNFVGLANGTATVAIYSSIDSSINKTVKVTVAGKQTIRIANNRSYLSCGEGPNYNQELFSYVRGAGYKTREGVVAAAIYLSSTMPNRVPYFWSGGHYHDWTFRNYGKVSPHSGGDFIGISKYFGCEARMDFGGTAVQPDGQYFKFGLDCSGFVAWAILNGGYFTGSNKIVISTKAKVSSIGGVSVESSSFSNAKGRIKPGDIVFKSGHTGMVIDVSDSKLTIAEAAGAKKGLIISTTGLSGSGWSSVSLMDNFYNNYQKDVPIWSGFPGV